jgi:nitroimidazol reductase NimA-like FMN-containing flavoprotein (pyridoxamine 5'-phosphate oxidase superfamily)
MNTEQRDAILEALAGNNILTLATQRADGFPQATIVEYASDGLTVYFACGPQTQKVANIRACDKVSVAIGRDVADWTRIAGLSMAARARILAAPAEIERATVAYIAKFPHMTRDILAHATFVALSPSVVSIIDYTKGWGHTELVDTSRAA